MIAFDKDNISTFSRLTPVGTPCAILVNVIFLFLSLSSIYKIKASLAKLGVTANKICFTSDFSTSFSKSLII